jgi:hypothetical protein
VGLPQSYLVITKASPVTCPGGAFASPEHNQIPHCPAEEDRVGVQGRERGRLREMRKGVFPFPYPLACLEDPAEQLSGFLLVTFLFPLEKKSDIV